MEDEDDDIGAYLHLLRAIRQFTLSQQATGHAPVMRVPRLPSGLREHERFFATIYANANPRVFRDNFRVNRALFDELFAWCEPVMTDGVRSRREMLAVTLDWYATGSTVRAQETRFQLAYSTCHRYRILGTCTIVRALSRLIRLFTSDFAPPRVCRTSDNSSASISWLQFAFPSGSPAGVVAISVMFPFVVFSLLVSCAPRLK